MAKDKPFSFSSDAQFLSRVRAAEAVSCSTQLIDKMIRDGRLRGFRLGRKIVVRKGELFRVVEAGEIQ